MDNLYTETLTTRVTEFVCSRIRSLTGPKEPAAIPDAEGCLLNYQGATTEPPYPLIRESLRASSVCPCLPLAALWGGIRGAPRHNEYTRLAGRLAGKLSNL
eukprot:7817426-Pyramimonas_sp.AAC.3